MAVARGELAELRRPAVVADGLVVEHDGDGRRQIHGRRARARRRVAAEVVGPVGAQARRAHAAEGLAVRVGAVFRRRRDERRAFDERVRARPVRRERLDVLHVGVAGVLRRVLQSGPERADAARRVEQLVVVDVQQPLDAGRARARHGARDVDGLAVHLHEVVALRLGDEGRVDEGVPRRPQEQRRELGRVLAEHEEPLDADDGPVVDEPLLEVQGPLRHDHDAQPRPVPLADAPRRAPGRRREAHRRRLAGLHVVGLRGRRVVELLVLLSRRHGLRCDPRGFSGPPRRPREATPAGAAALDRPRQRFVHTTVTAIGEEVVDVLMLGDYRSLILLARLEPASLLEHRGSLRRRPPRESRSLRTARACRAVSFGRRGVRPPAVPALRRR